MGPEGADDIYQCKGTLTGHKGAIWMLQYDEEVRRLYSCCDDKKVISWDVINLKPAKVFDGHKDKVYRVRVRARVRVGFMVRVRS